MVIVQNSIKILDTVLGEQIVDTKSIYRAISFCVFAEIDGKYIVYNTLTGEIAELDGSERSVLEQPSVIPSEVFEELIKKWYLVPTDHDDIRLADEISSFAKMFEKHDGIKEYTIFTTTDCNARCFYCYEAGCAKVSMSRETAVAVADYIIANAPSDRVVHISWFGGEPLCNTEVMDIISDTLCNSGIRFTSQITSNGYLFDAEKIEKAVQKWKTTVVQVTLDGTESVYNSTKAYVSSCENPYITVTGNIEKLLKRNIKVVVRLNFGGHNKDDIYSLVDWLAERYVGCDGLSVYPRLVNKYEKGKMKKDDDISLSEKLIELENYCEEKKLFLSHKPIKSAIKINSCLADSDSAITILPDGNIGKCEHCLDDGYIGNIHCGITDGKMADSFKEKANNEDICNGCSMYPICIRLKKCPDVGEDICNEEFRMIEKRHLARRVKFTYKKLQES